MGMEIGLGPGHIVLDGDPAPPPQICGTSPNFRPMSGWIKMPLGMEVSLDPSDIVSDREPAPPPQKGAEPPIFGPCILWPNGCMDQNATCYGGRPRPRSHCVTWGPSSPPERGTAPNFRPMAIVAKRSPISANAEHLSSFLWSPCVADADIIFSSCGFYLLLFLA